MSGFDENCYWLASYFLEEERATTEQKKKLAQYIQDKIEDWIEFDLKALTNEKR